MISKSIEQNPDPATRRDADATSLAMRPPPAQRDRHSPPALIDDAMSEIFLRIPADDPKSLVRAAAVCTTWRRILCDLICTRQYRAFHGAPPMLGFLRNTRHEKEWEEGSWVSSFVSTASFRLPACHERRHWHVLDSRHGLVLFYTPRMIAEFVVCDLITSNQWEIHADPKCDDIMRWWKWEEEDENLEGICCNAAVLCANDRCDHLYCHGSPFRIALVGSVENGPKALATVYSSETCKWSDMISVENPNYINDSGQSGVVGNKVYVPCVESDSVVEYNMDEQKLSVIVAPDTNHPNYIHLMGVEDGMLLFASVVKPRLLLWSMEVGPNGAVGWARHWIIELGPLLPPDVLLDRSDVSAVGFAEGVCVIFLSTRDGLYTVDLNSCEGKKVQERQIGKVVPYMSFYTGEWGRLSTSHQASRAVVGATTI